MPSILSVNLANVLTSHVSLRASLSTTSETSRAAIATPTITERMNIGGPVVPSARFKRISRTVKTNLKNANPNSTERAVSSSNLSTITRASRSAGPDNSCISTDSLSTPGFPRRSTGMPSTYRLECLSHSRI